MSNAPELDRALAIHREGRVREAAAIYQRILDGDPTSAQALHYLGLAHMQLSNLDRAAALLSRSLEFEPSCANTLSDLGAVFVKQQRSGKALELLSRALEIDPRHPDALNNMGVALDNLKRPIEALPYFERLVEVRPNSAGAWAHLAETCLTLNQTENSIAHFRRALKLNPDLNTQRILFGEALETAGRFRQATFQYVTVLEKDPGNVVALARLLALPSELPDPQWATKAHALLATGRLGPQERIRLHIALGQHYDRSGDCDRAFENFQASHKLRSGNTSFDSGGFSAAIDRLIQFFTPELFASLPVPTMRSDRPIFIVGMPRSGTTLTEQILASHGKVSAGGELPTIMNLASQIQALTSSQSAYPDCVQDLSAADCEKLARAYLDRLAEGSGDAERVTDKLPFNFMHLGLIAALFPAAKIIHCRRSPLDTCLSCYFVSFAEELQFTSDLETLGRYYMDYQRLMRHWHRVLPVPIHDLDYERLVRDTEPAVRELLNYCELNWDDACLRFYETERGVRTPSRWQVRQPIYSQSVGRWRQYERHLEPLKRIIQPR